MLLVCVPFVSGCFSLLSALHDLALVHLVVLLSLLSPLHMFYYNSSNAENCLLII